MKQKENERIFGLDLLRSMAIVFVVIVHSDFMATAFPGFPWLRLPDGVDLFFVLSGFLVGTLLIRSAENKQRFGQSEVFSFLRRRWFRTLPNYFLFLLINILLIYAGVIKGTLNQYLVTYFVFFQNFYQPFDFLFWESWSLAVEEWFYLLFPLLVATVFFVSRNKIKVRLGVLFTIGVFILVPVYFRYINSLSGLDADLYLRKLVLTRLDAIGYGLLAAWFAFYLPALWRRIRYPFFVAGLVLMLILLWTNRDFTGDVFYFSLMAIATAMLLPFLHHLTIERIPLKPFRFISRVSYSLYLLHLPLMQVMLGIYLPAGKADGLLFYAIYWMLALALSFVVFRFFEKPLTDMRERMVRR